jgi:hypothetical protein
MLEGSRALRQVIAVKEGCVTCPETKFVAYSLLTICCMLFLLLQEHVDFKPKTRGKSCHNKIMSISIDRTNSASYFIKSLHHCSNIDTADVSAGAIYINTMIPLPRAYFRTRIVGPKVTLLYARRISANVYEVPYENLVPGQYSFECILLYVDFDEDAFGSMKPISFLSINEPYFFNISRSESKKNSFIDSGSLETGDSNLSEGEWIVNDSEIAHYLHRTRSGTNDSLWPPKHPLIHSLVPDFDNSKKLYFQSKQFSTNFIDGTQNYSALSCLLDINVCLWGDSQMRNLHNSALVLLKNSSELNLDALIADPHTVLEGHNKFHYYGKTYSGFQENIDELLAQNTCQVIIANFGQWPASWSAGYPWSFMEYTTHVNADIEFLSKMQEKYPKAKLFWMTTNAFALHDQIYGTDWRIDPVLERYNTIANNIAKNYGIKVMNTFDIAIVLSDLSFDWGHYRGVVGWSQGNYLLNILLQAMC